LLNNDEISTNAPLLLPPLKKLFINQGFLMPYPQEIREKLVQIYEDMIWLANRPHNSPARARSWYTSTWSPALSSSIRIFSGNVSSAAIRNPDGLLCLEHYNRLAASITQLIQKHTANNIEDHDTFLELIEECERVNITTDEENHTIQTNKGDYKASGIILISWENISHDIRSILFRNCLRGRVVNSKDYEG